MMSVLIGEDVVFDIVGYGKIVRLEEFYYFWILIGSMNLFV